MSLCKISRIFAMGSVATGDVRKSNEDFIGHLDQDIRKEHIGHRQDCCIIHRSKLLSTRRAHPLVAGESR